MRHEILRQIAQYDPDHAAKLRKDNFEALIAYWEQFNPTVVERAISTHERGIFDFGAIHSTYDDAGRLNQVKALLEDFGAVILLLPCPDRQKSLDILTTRGQEPGMSEATLAMWSRIVNRFILHRSNDQLCTLTVFTEGKLPEMTCEEIISRLRLCPRLS